MFLETKISQFLFSVTKLIGHPEQNFNLHINKSKYKQFEKSFSREDFKNTCAKFHPAGAVEKRIETL